jgi:hypothetical protein
MSMDRPRQPAFWRFGVGVVGGGPFCGLGVCTRTFATKSVSYRVRAVNACCFAPLTEAAVAAETDAREDVDVREVVVPCERMEERSEAVVAVDWTEVRAEGGRERGGGYGAGGGTGGGGAARRVLAREREELLAEGVRCGIGEPGEGEEPCEAKLLMGLRAWGVGRWGSLGGGGCGSCCLVAAGNAGFPGGFWGRGGRAMGGRKEEGAETFSKDSSRLSPSSVPVPVHSRSIGNACRAPAPHGVMKSSPPSEERETEWREETEEADTCP